LADTKKRLNSNINVLPVILSGGVGTRLWPLSRASYPKQYLAINEDNKFTLIQNTYLRLRNIKNLLSPLIVCNEEQRFIVAEQMREINVEPNSILLEPFGKNTAPAIALSALMSVDKYNDPILLVLPSDHKIKNIEIFNQTIAEGISLANKGSLVTFGIVPKSAETQYGYIESSERIFGEIKSSNIKKFIEKPSKEIAEKLFKNEHYTWNSGIYLFRASTILKELNKFAPFIVEICQKSLEGSKKDLNFQRIDSQLFKKCTNVSIDIAVMEKTKLGKVIPLNVGWNDLGNWKSVWEDSKKDIKNNTFQGKVFAKNVKNTYLRSENRLLVGLGLQDLFIVETEDSVLVANKESVNEIKELIKELKDNNTQELISTKKVHRPWGNFTSIMKGATWQVKRIVINPRQSLSLQMHQYRSEHWVVVKGIAKVEINNEVSLLKVNESIYVPIKSKHRLSNPSNNELILIEVQSGTYLGEDDIIRFEDIYKRP
tara:strand:- start:18901 stop:20358 length:1458 start_codon:yes stop_codon:yes gene_type:complete